MAKKIVSVGELLPLVCTLGFVTLQTVYMHKKIYNTLKKRDKPESIIGLSDEHLFGGEAHPGLLWGQSA